MTSGAPEPRDPERGSAAKTVRVARVLDGLSTSVQRFPSALDLELEATVGAALRSALDVLNPDGHGTRPLALGGDGAVLEVHVAVADPAGLIPAGELLESVQGNLRPAPASRGWMLRVPTVARPRVFLTLLQGNLAMAVPWHAVQRVRMMPRNGADPAAWTEGVPVLPSFARTEGDQLDSPAILIGLGIRRAYLPADRLVWRMGLQDAGLPPPEESTTLRRALCSEEDEIYWELDLPRLLALVPPPFTLEPKAASREPRRPAAEPAPRLIELRREDVEPLEEARSVEPAPLPPPLAMSPSPAVEAPRPHSVSRPKLAPGARVLIAEDSITARIFLERLLGQMGLVVDSASNARELRLHSERGPWAVVFADVDLPDAVGEHLLELVARAPAAGYTLVALVRDEADREAARRAGVTHSLGKPFEREALVELLLQLGFMEARG